MAGIWAHDGAVRIHDDRCGGAPYYAVTCYACLGSGRPCVTCDRSGRLPMNRCVPCLGAGQVDEAIDMHRWAKRSVLPVGGGILDQSRTWLRACRFIDRLWDHHEGKSTLDG